MKRIDHLCYRFRNKSDYTLEKMFMPRAPFFKTSSRLVLILYSTSDMPSYMYIHKNIERKLENMLAGRGHLSTVRSNLCTDEI